MIQKIDHVETGGAWNASNIKRDAGAAWNNKAVRIFVVLVVIGMAVKYFAGV